MEAALLTVSGCCEPSEDESKAQAGQRRFLMLPMTVLFRGYSAELLPANIPEERLNLLLVKFSSDYRGF